VAARPGMTQLLAQIKGGNEDALAKLIPIVYKELRRLAAYMRGERLSHTLQPTALVHEAYLRLLGQDRVDCRTRALHGGGRADDAQDPGESRGRAQDKSEPPRGNGLNRWTRVWHCVTSERSWRWMRHSGG